MLGVYHKRYDYDPTAPIWFLWGEGAITQKSFMPFSVFQSDTQRFFFLQQLVINHTTFTTDLASFRVITKRFHSSAVTKRSWHKVVQRVILHSEQFTHDKVVMCKCGVWGALPFRLTCSHTRCFTFGASREVEQWRLLIRPLFWLHRCVLGMQNSLLVVFTG